MKKFWIGILPLTLTISACSTSKVNPLLSQDPDVQFARKDFNEKQIQLEQLWSERHQLSSLNSFIDLARQISNSQNRTFTWMTRLARAYYLRAEYFDSDPQEKISDWETGANWAEKSLTLNPEYRNRVLNQRLPPEVAMTSLRESEMPGLYWYAANLGKWANQNGTLSILKYKERIKRIIDRIAAVTPDLYYGAVHRYYGAYYALLPGYNRDELDLSRRNFEAAVIKFPNYFTNHTLYAQTYGVKMKDSALVEQQLRWVVKANPKLIPDFYPEQILEQKKAAALLRK